MRREIGVGPWSTEPDQLDWTDEATGLPVAMRRNPFHAWCGYVGVPDDHPWHGTESYDRPGDVVRVHGGLTYSSEAPGCETSDPRSTWWFGFDCSHSGDISPGLAINYGVYRDVDYVRSECADLARDLSDAAIVTPS